MNLASRNLVQDKTRLVLSAVGVALAIMLILILTGFVSGLELQVSRYLDHAPGSVVLVQAGTRGTSSVVPTNTLPAKTVDAARSVRGMASAVPVISQCAVLDLGQTKQFVVVIGYDSALGGGPWALREGRLPQSDDEVVLDGVLAGRRGVRLNDTFGLMSYLFMRLGAAQRLYATPSTVSMVVVTPAGGVSPEELRSRLKGVPGADAKLKSDLIAGTRSFNMSALGAALQLAAQTFKR
jgi:putative ABC transport system permease protein